MELPLVEEVELYMVGYGDVSFPSATWTTSTPQISFTLDDRDALVAEHGAGSLWVRQLGTYAASAALLLTQFN